MASAGIRIDRARLHGGVRGDGARLGDALARLTPAELGLSPHATLVVRRVKLKQPLPRHGAAGGFIAEVRDELRARTVTARRSGTMSDSAD